tara:strand:- start:3605 stop:3763 length:159 start_codon:yes stop_codon:yes gene_type:complete
MKKYKYFYINDLKKEACGTLYAGDINEAFAIACRMKELTLDSFKEIFDIKLL